MPSSNSQLAWRAGDSLQYHPDMPDWLKRQFIYQDGGEAGGPGQWVMPDAPVDENGNQLVLADDRGDIIANGELALREGRAARYIPGLGWAANLADTDSTGKFERRQRRGKIIAGTIIGGAALAGMAGVGAAGAGAGAGSAAPGAGFTIGAEGAAGVGAGATGGASFSGLGGGGLAGLGEAVGSGGGSSSAATVPENLALSQGAGGASPALAEIPAIQQAGGATPGLWDRAVSSLGGYGNIARGALGLASLGAAREGTSGGETNPQSIIEQMANANRVNHNTPFGSRAWSQGADGRWTVNDSLSPEEQANYEGVRGLNSNVTNTARDRLAAFMAQAPRGRYDRPLGS